MSRRAVAFDLTRLIERTDYLRRPPPFQHPTDGYKEWLHFCVYGADVDVLVNFSTVEDVREGARPGDEHARVTVLVRERGSGWDGDVVLHPREAVTVRGGAVEMRFGRDHVRFEDGVYHVVAELPRRDIAVRLALRPECLPTVAHNVQLDSGPPINWLVIPRLRAAGVVSLRGQARVIEHALGYHDHNWGAFAWGHDFAWEWGFGLPDRADNPWSVVFVRLSDRAHAAVYKQAIFLWRGALPWRVLHSEGVTVEREGFLRPREVLKIPRAMALVAPSTATDVPRRLRVRAEDGGDRIECEFDGEEVAQVIVPNDRDLGVTIINEVSGWLRARGVVRGEAVAMEGHAIFEFLGA